MNVLSMSERFLGDNPFSSHNTAFDSLRLAEYPGNGTAEWNQRNISEILQRQKDTNEGCFFAGLYMLSRAFYPDRPLPDIDVYWDELPIRYGHLLEPRRIMVPHDKLAQAYEEIYENEWGIALTKYHLNGTGQKIIGGSMSPWRNPATVRPGFKSLETGKIATPYSILMHLAGGSDTHFITDDGSEEAHMMRSMYEDQRYRTIALFEFNPVPIGVPGSSNTVTYEYA